MDYNAEGWLYTHWLNQISPHMYDFIVYNLINAIGSQFVACGKDTAVRVYDEATKTAVVTMRGGMGYSNKVTSGHSNRVFSAKFNPNDENLVITGGK